MFRKQKIKGLQYQFTVYVQEAVINVKFPCTFSLAWKVDKITIDDPTKFQIINNKINFDKELKSSAVQIAYNEIKQKYVEKKTTLCVNLNSFNKPNQTKLAGIITLQLTQFINQQSSDEKKFKRYELERCPDKASYLMIWVKAQMIKELNADQFSESSFSQKKSNVLGNKLQSKSSISRSMVSSFQKQDKQKNDSFDKQVINPITHRRSPKKNALKKSYVSFGEKTMGFFPREEDQIEDQQRDFNGDFNDKIKSSPTFDRDMKKQYDRMIGQTNKLRLLNEDLQGKLYTIQKKLVMGRSQQSNKVIQLAKQNQNLRKQLLEKNIQIFSIKQEIESQQNQMKDIHTGITSERLIKIKQRHEDDIKKMTKIKQEYQSQLKKMKQELAKCKNFQEQQNRTIEQLQQQIRFLKSKNSQLQKNIERQSYQNRQTMASLRSLQQVSSIQIAQLNQHIQRLTNQIYNAQQSIERQQQIISEYQQTLLKYKTKQFQMQSNFAAIQQECLQIMNTLKSKQNIQGQLNQKITQLENQLNSVLSTPFQNKDQKQMIKLQTLQDTLQILQTQNEKLTNNCNTLNQQLLQCKNAIKQFDAIQKSRLESMTSSRTFSEMNENYQKRKVSKRERIKELQNNKRQLCEKLNEMYLQIMKLNEVIYDSNTQIKNQKQEINSEKQKNQELVKQLQNLKTQKQNEKINSSINKIGKKSEITGPTPKIINRVNDHQSKDTKFLEQELQKQKQKNLEHQRRHKEMLVYIEELRNQQLKLDEQLIIRQSQIQLIKQNSSSFFLFDKNSSNKEDKQMLMKELIQELNNKISELSRIQNNIKQISVPIAKKPTPLTTEIGAAATARQLSLEFAKLKKKKLQKVYDINEKRNIIQQLNPIQRKIEILQSKLWS